MLGARNWTGTQLESKLMFYKLAADKLVLHMTVRDSRQVLRVQQGRGNQENQAFLADQRDQLVRDHQGNLEYLVCLVVQLGLVGREVREVRLVLVDRGIQESRVYLEVQRVPGHQGSQEFQLGRDSHPCLVYQEVLVSLNCE